MDRSSRIFNDQAVIDRRRFLHRSGTFGLMCLVAPMIAGCQILAARDDHRHTVRITDRRSFEPAGLTIPLGDTVVWENMSNIRHAVTTDPSGLEDVQAVAVPSGVQPFSSSDLSPGETWALTFTIPGSYIYVCPYHHDRGMIGTIEVVDE